MTDKMIECLKNHPTVKIMAKAELLAKVSHQMDMPIGTILANNLDFSEDLSPKELKQLKKEAKKILSLLKQDPSLFEIEETEKFKSFMSELDSKSPSNNPELYW